MTVLDPIRFAVAQRAGWRCEVRLPGCGETYRLGFHHRFTKGRPDSEANLLLVCADCHTDSSSAIHRNPAAAYDRGLLIHSWDGMPDEPWVRPDDGTHPQSCGPE